MADAKRQRWGWPLVAPFTATAASVSAHNLDATTDGCGWVTSAESTDAITKVGFLVGTRTGSGAITYTVGLESVSTSTGLPSGTYLQNGGNDCKTVITPATDSSWNNLWRTATLDYSYTPASIGEVFVPTVRYASGVSGTEYLSIATHENATALGHATFSRPYAVRLTGGTWASQSSMPIFALYTASACYGRPYQSTYSTAIPSTAGRRIGTYFTMPAGHGSTFQLRGFNCYAMISTAGGKTPKAGIWAASGGGTLQSIILDVDQCRTTGSARNFIEVPFSSLVTLDYGTAYYAGFEVVDATNAGITLYGTKYGSSDEIEAEPYGADWCLGTYDGSSWTNDTTVRPYLELVPADITVPSGGGAWPGLVIGNIGTY